MSFQKLMLGSPVVYFQMWDQSAAVPYFHPGDACQTQGCGAWAGGRRVQVIRFDADQAKSSGDLWRWDTYSFGNQDLPRMGLGLSAVWTVDISRS
ncbi:hypothetical protein RRG08_022157 [Elysia crispata]|uniref:Uncharacterized protein n=1 Tax=Elysia crispata TaxID=231223 RepID=A0AAE1AH46_9GAST|nr:hypothetical protein RRG08_022157 [Elysia crispata]